MILYNEARVAKIVGVTRPEFRRLRKKLFVKEADWDMHGNAVVVTERGMDKLKAHLGDGAAALDYSRAIVKQNGASEASSDEVELVVRTVYPNPRLLSCVFHMEPNGGLVRVRVPRNDNFRPGMKIKARRLFDGFYELVGRCPRFPGKW